MSQNGVTAPVLTIYPAIDLRDGRCVRLEQGDPDRETTFSDDPASMARRWVSEGAQWLHVVDLDGAFTGERRNAQAIAEIVAAVDVPVQLGGGLRSIEAIRGAVDVGIARVVIGTAALERPELVEEAASEFRERVAVGIDARDGFVATHGWKHTTDVKASDLAARMQALGASVIIYTDIGRDGMLKGPNVDATAGLARSLDIPVIASGGVTTVADVETIASFMSAGIEGVIIGRALYTAQFTLAEALSAANGSLER